MTSRERASGKWQIPAFLLATVLLGISAVTYRSELEKLPFDELGDELPVLVERGLYTAAIESAVRLLEVPDKTPRQRGDVHLQLARALLLRATRNGAVSSRSAEMGIEHFGLAVSAGVGLDLEDHELLGRAFEWTGRFPEAVAHYDKVIASSTQPDLDLRWRVAQLRGRHAEAPLDFQHDELDGLIAEASGRPDVLCWAAERKTELLCNEDRSAEALRMLAEVSSGLEEEGPWPGWFEYLRSYALFRGGDHDAAESSLRLLRNQLVLRDDLYARTGWLLGKAVLGTAYDGRPQEALSFFYEVVSGTTAPVYRVASELGMAEALVVLERYEEALRRYRAVASGLKRLAPNKLVDRSVLESSLALASDHLGSRGALEAAVLFAEEATRVGPTLAEKTSKSAASSKSVARVDVGAADVKALGRRALLLERWGDLLAALASQKREKARSLRTMAAGKEVAPPDRGATNDPPAPDSVEGEVRRLHAEARSLFLRAGSVFEEIDRLETMNVERASTMAWRAAELTNESGDAAATVASMEGFIRSRPQSPMVPRALLWLGEARQALGRYSEAVAAYQDNLRRFPRTPDAGSGLIPLARCYLAMGPEHAEQAEKTLSIILDDSPVFTPRAPEYADALFLLGDLLNRRGMYERAITAQEEAIERYPNDLRVAQARFLLADSYRQSGLALMERYESAPTVEMKRQVLAERKNRLDQAADLFGGIVSAYASGAQPYRVPGSRLDELYARQARLYQADCLFEMKRYAEALALYEQAAWIYKDRVTVLSSYVQIINCHLFTGNRQAAAAALRRARFLAEALPDDAFQEEGQQETREDWLTHFDWLARSELF